MAKVKGDEKLVAWSLRVPKWVADEVDKAAVASRLSRNSFVVKVLEMAVQFDKSFSKSGLGTMLAGVFERVVSDGLKGRKGSK